MAGEKKMVVKRKIRSVMLDIKVEMYNFRDIFFSLLASARSPSNLFRSRWKLSDKKHLYAA